MEKSKKQALILSIVAVVTLIALVVGATYAYFKAQGGTGSSTEVKVTTYTTDMLTFTTGNAISLYADQSSFGQEKGSLSGETFAKATLVANNKTNEATDNYYVYFNIENNTFKYTLGNDKPELILTVTGPDGNEVTEISGLTHTTVKDRENKSISGFDVTTTNGLITIANKKTITATPSKEEQYTLKLTFVNYEGDQTENATSTLSAKVMIQKEPIVTTTLADYVKSLYVSNKGENGIYYHDVTLTNGAGDNSYRFAGASDAVNNYVCFGSNVTPCPIDNLYRIIGVFDNQVGENQTEQRVKLIKYDYTTSALLGTDGDYKQVLYTDTRFSTSNYKGNNLANIATYAWNKTDQNIWSMSNLNKTNLNTNFITNIGADWAAKIADTTWKVGGNTFANIAEQPAKTAYQNEVVQPAPGEYSSETEYSAKVGLMYASDFGFAAAPSAWTTIIRNYRGEAIKNVNWMYMGLTEWTISRVTDRFGSKAANALVAYDAGDIYTYGSNDTISVRPVFNLKSSVTYVSGDGTQNSPIRIN
ncbi:hypothetical protein EGP99_00495 [bacterium]|nr:hypothetical protein [bacterium]